MTRTPTAGWPSSFRCPWGTPRARCRGGDGQHGGGGGGAGGGLQELGRRAVRVSRDAHLRRDRLVGEVVVRDQRTLSAALLLLRRRQRAPGKLHQAQALRPAAADGGGEAAVADADFGAAGAVRGSGEEHAGDTRRAGCLLVQYGDAGFTARRACATPGWGDGDRYTAGLDSGCSATGQAERRRTLGRPGRRLLCTGHVGLTLVGLPVPRDLFPSLLRAQAPERLHLAHPRLGHVGASQS